MQLQVATIQILHMPRPLHLLHLPVLGAAFMALMFPIIRVQLIGHKFWHQAKRLHMQSVQRVLQSTMPCSPPI